MPYGGGAHSDVAGDEPVSRIKHGKHSRELRLLNGVDPFDQPGVEEGKILARQYLAEK